MKYWLLMSLLLNDAFGKSSNDAQIVTPPPFPNGPVYTNTSSTSWSDTTPTTSIATTSTRRATIRSSATPQRATSGYTTITLSEWSYVPTPSSGATPTCQAGSTTTYFNTVYPTVTSTIDITYSVIVTSSATPIIETETPLQPCAGVVISISTQLPPQMTLSSRPPGAESELPTLDPPGVTVGFPPAQPGSTTIALGEFTATVIITKKTTVPIVPTGPVTAPVTFRATTAPSSNGGGKDPGGNGGGSGGNSNPGNRPGNNGSGGIPPVQAIPGTVTIGGETVHIGSTDITIGSSIIVLPTVQQQGSQVTVNDRTFTIQPNQVVGQGTTYNIPLTTVASTITQGPSTVNVNGVMITIGASEAVISGIHYRIGIPSDPQTITINGQIITLNSNGVVFPSTTLSPAMTIAVVGNSMYKVIVINGITISIDATEAIISGTTIQIGKGAASISVLTVNGQTMTAGPDGLAVGSTTISPTSLGGTATMTPAPAAGAATSTLRPTGGNDAKGSTEENAAASLQMGPENSVSALCFIALLALLVVI